MGMAKIESPHLKDRATAFLGRVPLIKQLADWSCRRGGVIFAFHRVLPIGQQCFDPEMSTSEKMFSDFLDWIAAQYQVLPLNEIQRQTRGDFGKRPKCAITFDDGWQDNFQFAMPHLRRHGFPATVFLPVHFIGTSRRFWQERLWFCMRSIADKERSVSLIRAVAERLPWFPTDARYYTSYVALKRLLLARPSTEAEEFTDSVVQQVDSVEEISGRAFLNWDEVSSMQEQGIQFGAHTLNHTLLPNAPPHVARKEIQESGEELRARLRSEVCGFAYPWGAWGRHTLEQVEMSGYPFAVTTQPGLISKDSDPFLLSRVPISSLVLDGGVGQFDSGKVRMSFAKNLVVNRRRAHHIRDSGAQRDKRIKILFVIDLITEWEGGTERQLKLLIESLDRTYFEPMLCFVFEAPNLPKNSIPCDLRVVCENEYSTASMPRRLWRLIQIIREERPQIVQTFFVEGLMFGILAARIARVPYIVGSVRNAGYWKKRRHALFMRAVRGLANSWQTNSRSLWRYQVRDEHTDPDRVEILPNGVNLRRFRMPTEDEVRKLRQQLALNPEGPICVSVANLFEVKDIPTLLDAASRLRKRYMGIQFVVVGDGPLRNELEGRSANMGLRDVVLFVGRKSDVWPYLATADLGILTSRSEGSSNSVLEYMAMGLPAVLSDIQANRELTQEVLFRPGSGEDLADKVVHLWEDRKLRARISSEYRSLASEYSNDKLESRGQSFYSRLSSGR